MCERLQILSISVPGNLQVGRKYRIIIISFYQISEYRKVQNRKKADRNNLRIANYEVTSPHGATAPSGPGPSHCRDFTITVT